MGVRVQVDVHPYADAVVITPSGTIDSRGATGLEQVVHRLPLNTAATVVVDLATAMFTEASECRLVDTLSRLARAGVRVVLANAPRGLPDRFPDPSLGVLWHVLPVGGPSSWRDVLPLVARVRGRRR